MNSDSAGRDEIESTPIRHKLHGAFINPGPRVIGVATGIGDYREWLDYEAEQANTESKQERQERFTPQPELTIQYENLNAVGDDPPYELSISERWKIASQVEHAMPRLDGEDVWDHLKRLQEATQCTKLARSFERWVQAGCPITKGR